MNPANDPLAPQSETEAVARSGGVAGSLQWWPSLAAIAFAAFVVFDMARGVELAPVLAASGLVYLGAASLQRPWTGWPLFLLTFLVITPYGAGLTTFNPTWILLGLAAAFFAYGLVRGALQPPGGLPLQSIAMIVFGAMAAAALLIDATAGAYLVAAGLLGHAAWDVYHHRVNKVVSRSMAEFCCVLDVLLAAAIIFVTLRG